MDKAERITIAGFGGQGVMMMGQMLAYAANEENLNSLWFPSYGPETRGGTANCSITISPNYINSPVFSKADTLMVLNKPSLLRFQQKVVKNGMIIYNSSFITEYQPNEDVRGYAIPANDIANELGNTKVANMVILGAYLELTNIFSEELMKKVLIKFLGPEKEHLIGINIDAVNEGRKIIKSLGASKC